MELQVKNDIIETFYRMTLEQGLKKTNLDEVSRNMKISKKTIYKYFKSKDELVECVVEKLVNDISSIADKYLNCDMPAIERYINIFSGIAHYFMGIDQRLIKDIQLLYPQLFQKMNEVRTQKILMFSKILNEGIKEGSFKNINPVIVTSVITASINSILNPTFLSDNSIKVEDAIENLCVILLEGIRLEKE